MEPQAAAPVPDPASRRKKSLLKPLSVQASGAILWGVFFSIMPIVEVLVMGAVLWSPLLVWREFARSKKHGFLPGFVFRAAVIAAIVTAAVLAPVKFEDQFIVKGLPGKTVRLEELSRGMPISVPDSHKDARIVLPSDRPTHRQAIAAIRQQTGLNYRTCRCGTGATVLWGTAPMGSYFVERY